MSVNYPVSVINQRLQDVVTAIDAGGGNGVMRLLDIGGTILSSLSLSRPAGTVSAGYLTFGSLPLIDPVAAATGNAVAARIEDSAGTIVISGLTVTGTSTSADIAMSPSNTITAGQTVAISFASIQGK